MKTDPLITPVHEARRRIAAELGNDPKRIVAYYVERQRKLQATDDVRYYSPLAEHKNPDLMLREKPDTN